MMDVMCVSTVIIASEDDLNVEKGCHVLNEGKKV